MKYDIINLDTPVIVGRLRFRDVMLDDEIGPTEGLIWIK